MFLKKFASPSETPSEPIYTTTNDATGIRLPEAIWKVRMKPWRWRRRSELRQRIIFLSCFVCSLLLINNQFVSFVQH